MQTAGVVPGSAPAEYRRYNFGHCPEEIMQTDVTYLTTMCGDRTGVTKPLLRLKLT